MKTDLGAQFRRLLVVGVALFGVLAATNPGQAGAAPAWSGPCHAAVDRYFPAGPVAQRMHQIVHRESRGIPTAVNRRAVGRYGRASGCAQLLPGFARPYLRAAGCSSLLEADCNIRAARALWNKARWSPWRT